MLIADDVVINPKEAPTSVVRVEKSLSEMGLSIRGANWGEVSSGDGTTTPRMRQIDLSLCVREEGATDLPTAAYELQQIVGSMQTEPETWIRRDFNVGGSFAGSLLYRLRPVRYGEEPQVTLANFAGWQAGDSPDVTVSMVSDWVGYATVEVESAEFTESEKRALIFELEDLLGTAPGLIRVRVKNEGEADWNGLILAGEWADHPQDETANTTAALEYACVDLTPVGAAAEAEREGLKVIRHSELTAGWVTVLDSQIDGVGHMTHRGTRRPHLRAWAGGTDVQYKLRYRPLGTLTWSENDVVAHPVAEGWQILDLKACRTQAPVLGDARWEAQLQMRATSGDGEADLHLFWPLPAEQFVKLIAPEGEAAAEEFDASNPGTVADDSSAGSVSWSNPSNAKASDNAYATATLAASTRSHFLLLTNFGFSLPSGAELIELEVLIEGKVSGGSNMRVYANPVIGGVIKKTFDMNLDVWSNTADEVHTATGTAKVLGLSKAALEESGFGFAIYAVNADSVERTISVDRGRVRAYFSGPSEDSKICFIQRSIELRTDGVFRQHTEDDVWGIVVPQGFYPTAQPAGLEGRKSRYIVIPTQGNFADRADVGNNSLGTQGTTRAGYHFAREAV